MANKKDKDKSEIGEIITNGVDEKNRRIYFGVDGDEDEHAGGVNWSSVENAIRALHKLSSDYKNKPIELHMCSPGGSPMDMLRLYDEIQRCSCKVIFVGGGETSSAATWIMAGCDERLLHKHTYVLLHDGSDSCHDRHTEFMIDASITLSTYF